MTSRRLPLGFAVALLAGGSIGISVAKNPVEVFLCAELVTIPTFYIFFTVIAPALRPVTVDTEGLFLGGVAKPPYLSPSELLTPGIPLISMELDKTWELYYDREKLRPKSLERREKN
ncbi:MAG: hypothetical protein QXT81_06050 [Candidatus Bathyarchaeia archaeon]